MTYAIGDTLSFIATFRNPDGSAATGVTVTALSKDAYTKAGASITFPSLSSFAEIGSTGRYRATAVPVTAGTYTVIAHATGAYLFPDYECGPFDVIAAAADGAALATAIAAVQATATAINDNVDVAVSSRASAAVWTSARASKVDQIGSAAAIIAAGSLQDGGRLELRRGNSCLAADGNAKTWSYTGPAIASATLTLRTFAGATVLQVPVTLAGETLSADLTIPQTMALALGTPIYRYEIEATLSAGGTSTLASGDVWTAD